MILAAANARYVRGEPIDIATLALENHVSRATAYRWLGDNDSLLAEVMRRRTRDAFRAAEKKHRRRLGRARVLAVLRTFLHRIADSKHFAELLRREPRRALMIVASRVHPNQEDLICLVQELLEHEVGHGRLALPFDARTLARIVVRLGEAFVYADVVAGGMPDPDRAVETVEVLLSPRSLPALSPVRAPAQARRKAAAPPRLSVESR